MGMWVFHTDDDLEQEQEQEQEAEATPKPKQSGGKHNTDSGILDDAMEVSASIVFPIVIALVSIKIGIVLIIAIGLLIEILS